MSYGKGDFLSWDDDDLNLDLLLGEYTCSELEVSDDETVEVQKKQPQTSSEKTYQCSECTNTYSSISGLRGHLNKKHGIRNVKGTMTGDDFVPEALAKYKGWQKYCNSYTKRGRVGVVVLSNVIVWSTVAMYKFTHRKKDIKA